MNGSATLWIVLLVVVTLFWGNSFIAIKHIVDYVTPLELVTVRFVPVALVFFVLLFAIYRRRLWFAIRSTGWQLIVLGLTGAVLYNIFLGWGETHVAAGTASLIISLNPAFTYSLSVLFLGEKLLWKRVIGIAIAFVGLFIIIRFGSGRPVALGDVMYAIITLLAPLMWATCTVSGKAVVERHPPFLVTGASLVFAGLFSLIFLNPSLLTRLPTFPASFWWSVLFLVLPCTVFGFAVWFGALEQFSAGRVAGFVYLVPMFGVVFSHLLLDEPITGASVIGAVILISGVWLVNRHS